MPGPVQPVGETAGDRSLKPTAGPQPSGAEGSEGVVARALRVLAEIAGSPDAVSPPLSELARRTHLPKSTVHRLLGVLESTGVVERDSAGYQLSPGAWALAGHSARDTVLSRAAMPFLMDLYRRVNEAVTLTVLRGDRVIYLVTLFDGRHQRFVDLTGLSGPPHATAAGKLLLAYQPRLPASYRNGRTLPAFTEHTITDPIEFATSLARIRQDAVAFNVEEHLPGTVGVAVPLVGARRGPIAAIAVGGLRARIDLTAMAAQLRRTSAAASAALAARYPPQQRGQGSSGDQPERRR